MTPRSRWFAPLALWAAVCWTFRGVSFGAGPTIVSQAGEDLTALFAPWREFGFTQLRQGNLALWNPHVFCGMPYFGNFESALLYPLNWPYLFLPLAAAINFGAALHTGLAGLFTYVWRRGRGTSVWGSFLAGLLFMFSAPVYLHIYPGHLPFLCAVTWVPAVFWALDGWLRDTKARWCLLGMAAAAMQILAGFPQMVYYTALAAALYASLRAVSSRRPALLLAGAASMYAGAAALAAVQLLAGLQAARQSERAVGLPFELARTFSFPPENLLTMLAPGVFGDMSSVPYFGRWRLWEASLFIGVSGLLLVLQAVLSRRARRVRLDMFMAITLTVLAFGAYTPLFRSLYAWLPGYALFRGASKFSALAALFLCGLAGTGFDSLMKGKSARAAAACAVLGAGLLAAMGARQYYYASAPAPAAADNLLFRGAVAGEDRLFSLVPQNVPIFLAKAAAFAGGQLFHAAATLALGALLLSLTAASRRWAYALLVLAVVEMGLFTRRFSATASIEVPHVALPAAAPADARVLHSDPRFPDIAMTLGQDDVWGYAPLVPRRYVDLTNLLQGGASKIPPTVAAMLRLRYVVKDKEGTVVTLPPALAHVQLVQDWDVRPASAAVLEALAAADFDPQKKVILESEPGLTPSPVLRTSSPPRIIASSTDWLEISAQVTQPSLLLITDNYSEGWRAVPLPDSSQRHYDLLPADYALRAVPLSPGKHHLRVEYAPAAFRAGAWISLLAWPSLLAVAAVRRKELFGA